MKRVLCIMNSTNVGGAETFIMKIFRAIDKEKFCIDFCINVFEDCAYDDEIKSLGGRIFRIPSKTENILKFKKELAKLVKSHKYKYVLRVTSNAGGFYDLKIAKKAGASICTARSSNSSDGNSIKQKIIHKIGKKMWIKYVDVRIAPSTNAAEYTFGSANRVNILHNGLDLNLFSYNSFNRKKIRSEFGIGDGSMLIGHVGRFEKQKNHLFLIDVFNEYQKINTNSFLILIGEGSLKRQIENKISLYGLEKKVIFAGLKNNINEIMSALDCIVFPSLYEGMPNSIIEAQACNLPCVLSDTITKEVAINDCVMFMSLEKNTASEWALKIRRLENRQGYDNHLAENGYDIKDVTTKFVNLVFGENND